MFIPKIFKVDTIIYCNSETIEYIKTGLLVMEKIYFNEALLIDNYLPFGVCYDETNGKFIEMFKWKVYFKRFIKRLIN